MSNKKVIYYEDGYNGELDIVGNEIKNWLSDKLSDSDYEESKYIIIELVDIE